MFIVAIIVYFPFLISFVLSISILFCRNFIKKRTDAIAFSCLALIAPLLPWLFLKFFFSLFDHTISVLWIIINLIQILIALKPWRDYDRYKEEHPEIDITSIQSKEKVKYVFPTILISLIFFVAATYVFGLINSRPNNDANYINNKNMQFEFLLMKYREHFYSGNTPEKCKEFLETILSNDNYSKSLNFQPKVRLISAISIPDMEDKVIRLATEEGLQPHNTVIVISYPLPNMNNLGYFAAITKRNHFFKSGKSKSTFEIRTKSILLEGPNMNPYSSTK